MLRNTRILIVDDRPANVAILEEILGEHYRLKVATCGEVALAIALDFQPALILLDIMMPGIGGYETCRRIRAHPALRHIKIIIVSARTLVAERLQGYEAGADDYITKPFDEEELLAKVRVHMRLRSLEEVEQCTSNILTLLRHETRTPLNGMLAPLQMLRTEPDMAAEERSMLLDMVYESAIALHHLVERVCTLSAMQAGQWDFRYAMTDLCAVVREVISNVATDATERAVTITPELPATAITRVDPLQIHQVIKALLENAVHFSPHGSPVGVRVVHMADGICLTVTDRGPGIAPDVFPRVFEAFTSTDITHHTTGHGLSLAIARQIILAHQGTIEVESTPGMGTTFTVQLPDMVCTASEEFLERLEVQSVYGQ
jgi:two-component system sensor histidine kinase/response regulator